MQPHLLTARQQLPERNLGNNGLEAAKEKDRKNNKEEIDRLKSKLRAVGGVDENHNVLDNQTAGDSLPASSAVSESQENETALANGKRKGENNVEDQPSKRITTPRNKNTAISRGSKATSED